MKKIVGLIALLLSSLPSFAQSADDVSGFYSGILGKNLAVTLSLRQDGSGVSGYYYYDRNKVSIRVAGTVGPSGAVVQEEYGYFEVTGVWKGVVSGGRFAGTWTSGDGTRTLPFTLDRTPMEGTPGEPLSRKVAFGAKAVELPAEEVSVPRTLAAGLFDGMVEMDEIDGETDAGADAMAKAKRNPSLLFRGQAVDLDHDGTPELVVSATDSACTAQNCSIWVLRRQGSEHVEILHGMAGTFGYEPLDLRSGGFHDIALLQHASAASTAYEVFQFDGDRYRPIRCVLRTYGDGDKISYREGCE